MAPRRGMSDTAWYRWTVTASLPVPQDLPSGEGGSTRPPQRGPRALPPPPAISAAEAAAQPPKPAPSGGAAVARKTRAPRKRIPKKTRTTDPGPPPPGLGDLVIPPKPPLPVTQAPAAIAVADPDVAAVMLVPPMPPAPIAAVAADTEAVVDAPEAEDIAAQDLGKPEIGVEPEGLVEPEVEPEQEAFVEPEDIVPDVATVEPEQEAFVEPEDLVPDAATIAPEVEPDAATVAPEVVEPVHAEPEPHPEPPVRSEPEVEPAAHDAVASVFETDLVAASVDVDTAALAAHGITKVFGDTRAVDGIDLVVPPGIFYGLVGPNGAGKTTALSMIAGLLRPDRGTITVAGVDAGAQPRAAKKLMGVLPDRLRTFDRLTGRQLLYYCGVLRGLAPSVVESRTADLARAFDLADSLARPVSDYSAGMTKKVMLAGAMIHSPRLLVLDEPFESVDPVSSSVILDILGAYVAHGGTVILSSHGMDLVERVCSRVAVMVAGQVLAEGTIDEVRGELTLEQRFVELAGGLSDVEGLEWLHTFSG